MDRIKLNMPSDFMFQSETQVRVTDLNYGNHLANDAVLGLVHEARIRFLQAFGFTEIDFAGKSLIMADSAIQYKSQAFLGDRLIMFVQPADPSKVGFNMYYRFVEKESQQDVAWAKTGMVCFDYHEKKVVALPELPSGFKFVRE